MKKIISVVLSVALLTVSFAANAAIQTNSKDDRLVNSKSRTNQVDSLPEKITKYKVAIANGGNVYTPEEIQTLKSKLIEAENLIHELQEPGK
jgi:hypothetical protein